MKKSHFSPTIVSTALVLAAIIAGCGTDAPLAEVCHISEDGTSEVLAIKGEQDLAAHLAHGDPSFGMGLKADCSGSVTFRVDPDIELSQGSLQGLQGGPPREVAALMGPDGTTDEFIVDEIEVQLNDMDEEELLMFMQLYDATILRDDVALVADDDGELYEAPGGMNGWRLIRIEPSTSALLDLPGRAAEAGYQGDFAFSSEAALRTFAATLRERAHKAAPNLVFEPHALIEHPDDFGGNVDWAEQWWMQEDSDPSTPGDQGLSVGVARAFDYLRHVGLPPRNGLWEPARIAIIDQGFDLDEVTGLGNPDYNNDPSKAPLQVDLIDFDGTAGGAYPRYPDRRMWHGQLAFGVASAYPRNAFGGAGTGGEYTRPILIRMSGTRADVAASIRTAYLMGADVINISWGGTCNWLCRGSEAFNDTHLQEEILNASNSGASVFVSAGNGPLDADGNRVPNHDIDKGETWVPCELSNVICVGAVDENGNNVWNYGSNVDIWAPTGVRSTVAPTSANEVGIDQVSEFGGTSCSSPFAAGIAALLKTARPDMHWDEVQSILQETANSSSDPRVSIGYVDALRAVQRAIPNPAPTVRLGSPTENGRYSPLQDVSFEAFLSDPPGLRFKGRVDFYSSLDALLCTTEGEANFMTCDGRLKSRGEHLIVALATDEFGASTLSEAVLVQVESSPPSARVITPENDATYYADQNVVFRGIVYDLDGEDFTELCPVPEGSACVEWSSSIDGVLSPASATQSALDFESTLSQGQHQITMLARDAFGETSSESVIVTVLPGRGVPTARILTLPSEVTWSQPFVLRGSARDPEDGRLSGSRLNWYSSLDGYLGSGAAVTVQLSPPPLNGAAVHTITLQAEDSDGNVGEDRFTVTLTRVE
jgi:hypothetical protein